ncbi:MAG: hypothetical protein PHF35_04090 [Candidatus Moranbacteria bacterium]|nr:hypothetical protein [Candidatus Moranbacteria bacterium]
MTNWAKSVNPGGIYASSIHVEYRQKRVSHQKYNFEKMGEFWGKTQEFARKYWEMGKIASFSAKKRLKGHISRKQEVYWPVFIAIILLLFVLASRAADAKSNGVPNNLPLEDGSKLDLIGFHKKKRLEDIRFAKALKDDSKEYLKKDISKIVKGTPMAAMIGSISEQDRTVAAFIVGIAMKESQFGVHSPHLSGHDCYNYWGYKGGGTTVAGGYTCFSSPEDAVVAVASRIEKMVKKGVQSPAQAISWKCGSSCAGHDPAGVRKWIADVGVNFYKINS